MSERDELHDLIEAAVEDRCYDAESYGPSSLSYGVAADATDAILAAGYRKPRTITTIEELDALTDGGVILSDEGGVFEREHGWWRATGSRDPMASSEVCTPATVLHEGTP